MAMRSVVTGFLLALVSGMLTRLVVVGVGTATTIFVGGVDPWGFLAGFALGFVPLQTFEILWFVRAARSRLRQAQG